MAVKQGRPKLFIAIEVCTIGGLALGVTRAAHAEPPPATAPPATSATASPAKTDATIDVDSPALDPAALAERESSRPHTLAQLGIGLLTLPGADVCLQGRACTKGDTSVEVDFWQFYRATRSFAIGAGAAIALKPTTDNPPSAGGIARDHTRSYFTVEAQARYYALRLQLLELWLGATAGGVVVSDRYTIPDSSQGTSAPAIIGPRASTVRTEGVTVGGVLGAQWSLAHNWGIGLSLRYARWFLTDTPSKTVFLDPATLSGDQGVFYAGLLCSYRISL